MNSKVEKEKSRLDWFFYFKRGYTSYLTYVINLLELAAILVLDFVILFHFTWQIATVFLLVISVPVVWSTVKIGIWDYVKGGKKIETRLHYQNDEVWKGVIMGVYALLRKEGLDKDADAFKETMLRYGVMHEDE